MIPLVLFGLFGSAVSLPASLSPTVSVKNGTYSGVYSPQYDQDFFLGMPYAQVRCLFITTIHHADFCLAA